MTPTAKGWGFIDPTGKLIIDGTFTSVSPFSDGLAPASVGGKFGFIDIGGKTVIPFKFEKANSFSEGLAAVELGGKWGFIDKRGAFVIQPELAKEPRDFIDGYSMNGADIGGMSLVLKKDFFIDKRGNKVTPPGSVSLMPFGDGEAWSGDFDSNGHSYWTVINKRFQPVSQKIMLCLVPMPFSEGLSAIISAPCQEPMKMGYISLDGKLAIQPTFESAGNFKGGLAKVEINNKWGFIDKEGRVKIEPKFDDVYDFSDGLAGVLIDGKLGFIDATGSFAIDPQFPKARLLDTGFVGDLAGIIMVQSASPVKLAVIYVNRKGAVVYGPVNFPFPLRK